MGDFADHVALMGDWTHSNPLLEAFFPSMINDTESIYADQTDQNRANVELDGASNSNDMAEAKTSFRGGFRERMAARGGFNHLRLNTENIITPAAADLSKDQENRSPYLTIPPGLSPTSLLDSPVFLSNSLVLPSPTTGNFPFAPNGHNQNATLLADDSDKGKENTFQDVNASSFALKPVAESSPFPYFYAVNKVNPPSFAAPQSFISSGTNISDTSLLHQSIEPSNIHFQNNAESIQQKTYTNNGNNLSTEQSYNVFGVQELSPPLDEQEVDDGERRSNEDPNVGGGPAEDGYNWRKYGQKPVKGSDYPRSYYKCTHLNCPVKKKVERSVEGHITEIIYKGAHNHPKPPSNHRLPLNSSNPLDETQLEQSKTSANGDLAWSTMQENLEGSRSSTLRDLSGVKYESLDRSSTLSNDEDDDRITHGSVSLGCDGEGEESESKRRRIESYGMDMVGASRAMREPRVVVQTLSDVDILDDGYRWRKYGQKVVKGNPNPRSYYKCTSPNCNVRKHVERASHDLKSVITTYEGKHNHDVPAARNSSSHINSGGSNTLPAQQDPSHFHRPNPSTTMGWFGRHQLGPYSLPNRSQLGSGPGFSYGTNQAGLASMGMAGLGHQSIGRQAQTMNDMAFMVPKMEPVSDSGLNASNASTVYKQLMSRLPPLGPQM